LEIGRTGAKRGKKMKEKKKVGLLMMIARMVKIKTGYFSIE